MCPGWVLPENDEFAYPFVEIRGFVEQDLFVSDKNPIKINPWCEGIAKTVCSVPGVWGGVHPRMDGAEIQGTEFADKPSGDGKKLDAIIGDDLVATQCKNEVGLLAEGVGVVPAFGNCGLGHYFKSKNMALQVRVATAFVAHEQF